ncbi:hypothetical protein ACS0PU_011149 [Formica fusca]
MGNRTKSVRPVRRDGGVVASPVGPAFSRSAPWHTYWRNPTPHAAPRRTRLRRAPCREPRATSGRFTYSPPIRSFLLLEAGLSTIARSLLSLSSASFSRYSCLRSLLDNLANNRDISYSASEICR